VANRVKYVQEWGFFRRRLATSWLVTHPFAA
jgi:hypothetical protein